MHFLKNLAGAALVLLCLHTAVAAGEMPDASLAIEWNGLLLTLAEAEDSFLTLKGVRAAAMMHLSMHDALNSIEPRYDLYSPGPNAPEADPTAAAAQAAFEIAVGQYPDQRARLEARLASDLRGVSHGAGREQGIALGKRVAAAVLSRRQADGWDAEAEYNWHPMGPGVYAEFREHSNTPDGFVFGAGWAAATPFFLESADQFRSPAPPEITSDAYTEAYDEVREVGRAKSSTRTEDQTHLALWWKDFVESSHNRLARALAARESLDLWEASRLFALLNCSVYDAYVNVFDNKFHFNHWRPYTAIRWAANDGNPKTMPETDWTNTHDHTYAFPSYPSAHGCACAAAMEAMEDTFGSDYAFEMRTERVDRAGPLSGKMDMDPPVRSFGSFDEAAMECSLSRVYLGIHFRYDSTEGTVLGSKIGKNAVDGFLRPRGH